MANRQPHSFWMGWYFPQGKTPPFKTIWDQDTSRGLSTLPTPDCSLLSQTRSCNHLAVCEET